MVEQPARERTRPVVRGAMAIGTFVALVCAFGCGKSRSEILDHEPGNGGSETSGGTAGEPSGGAGASGSGGGAGAGGQGGVAGAAGSGEAGETTCPEVAPGADRVTPWALQFGDTENQTGTAVLAAPDGIVYMAGAFLGTLDLGFGSWTSEVGAEPFVARLDPMGNALFARRLSGAGTGVSMALSKGGETLFVAGSFSGMLDFGDQALGPVSSTSAFVAAYDVCGHAVAARSLEGDESSRVSIYSIAAVGERVVVAGEFTGTLDLGGGVWTNLSTSGEAFVASFDESFNVVWSRRMVNTRSLSVAVDDDTKNVYVAGQLNGFLDAGASSVTAQRRAFVLGLDSDGTSLWSVVDEATSEDNGATSWFQAITLDTAGNVLALGSFIYASIDFGGHALDWMCCGDDVFVLSVRPDGVPLWNVLVDNYVSAEIAATGTGFVVVTSDASWYSFDAVRYDQDGVRLGSHRVGSGYINPFGIAYDSAGSLVATGELRADADLGTGPLEGTEGFDWDGFVARVPLE